MGLPFITITPISHSCVRFDSIRIIECAHYQGCTRHISNSCIESCSQRKHLKWHWICSWLISCVVYVTSCGFKLLVYATVVPIWNAYCFYQVHGRYPLPEHAWQSPPKFRVQHQSFGAWLKIVARLLSHVFVLKNSFHSNYCVNFNHFENSLLNLILSTLI